MCDRKRQDRKRQSQSKPHRAQVPTPYFYMPAMPPLGLIDVCEKWLARRRRRRQFRRLLTLSDAMLQDLGYERKTLERALAEGGDTAIIDPSARG